MDIYDEAVVTVGKVLGNRMSSQRYEAEAWAADILAALPSDVLRRLADEKDALAGREQNPDTIPGGP
jgi:hypothetical protein